MENPNVRGYRSTNSPAIPSESDVSMTSGRCMCCNSQLRFPVSVPCFRCTVCDTINDLGTSSPSQDPRRNGKNINLAQLKEAIRTCQESADFSCVERMIKDAFSSCDALNLSFGNGHAVTLEDCGVALDDVREAYRLILELPVYIIRSLMSATDSLLKRPGRKLKRKDDIKFLIIILENPLLLQHNFPQETQYHHNLLKRIFGLISSLCNETHHYLVNWFARLHKDILSKRVDLVNHFITYRLSKEQRSSKSPGITYDNDWRIVAAARVMALLFAANNSAQELPIFNFYNTLVDYIDLVLDYDSWQQRSGRFSFCQYPFLISMGAKTRILEVDARRQMENKVKEAIITILFQKRVTVPYLVLHIRRDYLIEDSLDQLSSHQMDLKKKLKIEFINEDGIDAGGLTKEWFLLLVRELFNPQYGMFTWDEESNYFWFNPASFETSDQYYLVGIIIGLAIYNSIILDIQFPLACYKKLLNLPVDLDDLKLFRPTLVKGLQMLLDYDGDDLEEVFCRDFVGEYEIFGEVQQIPLIPNGENIPVTKANRQEYVAKYSQFLLTQSIAKQFEPFKRGFYHVCGGNALSLFRPEEIELLVRGSAEALDLEQLKSVTEYDGFDKEEETVRNFWSIFGSMSPESQRRLLVFITGSDRIPATGIANLAFKISCLGEDSERFPIAHTCFNQLCLYRYSTREKLSEKLLTAITESEGFGLK
ncbi:putative E3 ubiquitin-protein ligase [Basidiobolus ranarum]|uniref:HECT-type E3 ubiquitin transferase n=1 Tax=Basidiobolus ranarum TaxID=34480 RepID=A0ABR2VY79_9FUNG